KTAFTMVDFFKAMRSTDTRDQNLPFFDTRPTTNVYGGWKDATGDPGKHMSHLSYANFFNPQQIPFVSWSLLKSYELNKNLFATKATDLLNEAAWGADYIMRNVDAAGYLYIAIFDDWGGSNNRQICEWGAPGNDAGRSANYQAAMREGAGIAIAALAKSSKMNLAAGTNTAANYLAAAEKLYNHLKSPGTGFKTKNIQYCNDHKENLIDWYCGLLASTELYKATNNTTYLVDSRVFLDKIIAVQNPQGWLSSDSAKLRPYYHAADEGLPVMAAVELASIDPQSVTKINTFLSAWIKWYVNVTREVTNPFNYVRQLQSAYVDPSGLQAAKTAFFLPHKNETGYWWQGENARLNSMATALVLAKRQITKNYNFNTDSISMLAEAQIDWVAGKNPFGICMLHNFGVQNYPAYGSKINITGGICNGITSDDLTETDISSMPYDNNGATAWQNWRWIEQWLPHNAWWLMSVATISNNLNNPYIDCNGVSGGEAFKDSCGKCVGGTTGFAPILSKANCSVTGLEDYEDVNQAFAVFPNPANESVIIQNNICNLFDIKVLDMQGNEVFSEVNFYNGNAINTSKFKPGIYSVAIRYENQVKKVKFAVVR
ncbi:MAG: glycoside hydrolase family 9 protein, partial [Opitutaceae bacterium]|nr:glycoside hydrolase family 9 protein [Cytophagales bacterium]